MFSKIFKSTILLSILVGAQISHGMTSTCNAWTYSGEYGSGYPAASCLASDPQPPVQQIMGGTQIEINDDGIGTFNVACIFEGNNVVPYRVYIDASHGGILCGPKSGISEMTSPGTSGSFAISCDNLSTDSTPVTITVGQINCSGDENQFSVTTGSGVTWSTSGD